MKKIKRWIAFSLVFCMFASMLPTIRLAASAASVNGTDISSENALQALGIDTSKIPDGVNLNSSDNPYGRSTVTIDPVSEVFEQGTSSSVLFGNNKPLNGSWNDFYTSSSMQDAKSQAVVGSYAATAMYAGNFSGATNGDSAQTVTVAAGARSPSGGLYLYFSDPVNDKKSGAITLMDTDRTIGSGDVVSDPTYFEYSGELLQNYLQVTCGDFNGDGVDEIAVYIPEQGNPRVAVYQLQIDDRQAFAEDPSSYYLDSTRWKDIWEYDLKESVGGQSCVPNMVSLTGGDFDRDGIDDLSVTWGYVFNFTQSNDDVQYCGSKNEILCGSETDMLQKSISIDLTYNGTPILRASVAYGDIDGDGVKDLVIGGELADDIRCSFKGNNSRFVAVYAYNGTGFSQTLGKNFNLFEKDSSGNYIYPVMTGHTQNNDGETAGTKADVFNSLDCMKADVTTVNMEGAGKPSDIYLDSLIIQYGDDGLSLLASLDNASSFNSYSNSYNPSGLYNGFYSEYGATAADLTGDTKQTLQVRLNYGDGSQTASSVNAKVEGVLTAETDSKDNVTNYDFNVNVLTDEVDFASSFCMMNTDEDTSFYQYTGKHRVVYSDPKVLAVLASPPYFKDLGGEGSSTGFTNSQGSGTENSSEYSVSAGIYAEYEHKVSFLGHDIETDMEREQEGKMTWETAKSSEMETSVSFETEAGQDSVAFYSIPMEYYDYDFYVPTLDSSGNVNGYDKQSMSVNIPHTAATVMLSLEQYEKIAANYSELPEIEGEVLTHTVGEPSTYPSSLSGYSDAVEYKGTNGSFAGVGYGDASIEQEIETKDETSSSSKWDTSIDFKIGGGAEGLIVGVIAGGAYGQGKVTISTESNAYSGKVKNLPESAENYGYYFAWSLFTYTCRVGDEKIPVVSYLVKDVTAPASLPSDFAQSSELTTDHSVGLTWSYPADSAVSGFQLYKYVEYPDGSGSYKLAFVPSSDIQYVDTDENGKTIRHYQYIVDGLADYTAYKYQIQTVRAFQPSNSIQSTVLEARTKASEGYPTIALNGVYKTTTNTYDTSGNVIGEVSKYSLQVYPDTSSTVSVLVNGSNYTYEPLYQWQKLDEKKGWTDITAATNSTYIFKNSGPADEGEYRCRVNVNYKSAEGELAISAYSEPFTLNYSKRTAAVTDNGFTADYSGKTVRLTLKSAQSGHTFAPSGNVTFNITGADYSASQVVALGAQDSNYTSTAILDLGSALNLPQGVYEITAFYQGSRVYESLPVSGTVYYASGNTSGYFLDADSNFTYGDTIAPTLTRVSGENGQIQFERLTSGVSFKLILKQAVTKSETVCVAVDSNTHKPVIRTITWTEYDDVEIPGSANTDGSLTARATGSYTLKAYVDGTETASKEVTINPRDITIGFKNAITNVAGSDGVSQPTCDDLKVTSGNLVYSDTLENLGLIVHAYNTADSEVPVNSQSSPGLYTICAGASGATGADYGCYNIKFETSTYTLTGPKYGMTIVSGTYGTDGVVGTLAITDPAVTNDDGTVLKMATSAVNNTWSKAVLFSQGIGIVLQAKPQAGYRVKSWTVKTGNSTTETDTSSTTFIYQTVAADTTFTVEYTPSDKLIFQSANPTANDGTVTPVGDSIQSGSYVIPGTKYTFLATPAKGYHFTEWTLSGSTNSNFKGNYDESTGTSTTTVTVGDSDMTLSAVFERDSYALTLQNNLQATYSVDDGTGKTVEKTVTGTATVPGGTMVTVTPRIGYSLKSGADWKVNGQTVENGGTSYAFTMAADTTVSADTVQNSYTVSLAVSQPDGTDKNAVAAKLNQDAADFSQNQNVPGGSSLDFTAEPAWGYVFDHWEVNGKAAGTDETLDVPALGNDLTILAVFKNNPDSYTVTVSNNSGGNLTYSVKFNGSGYSGNAPVDAAVDASGTKIVVYQGDSLTITAHPFLNQMLRLWTKNGDEISSGTQNAFCSGPISENMSITASFAYRTRTQVVYSAGSGGTIVSAASDGISFKSGDKIGIGSNVVFIAQPDNGMAVDHWTLNGEIVESSDHTIIEGDSLTIDSLDTAADVKAFFTASASDEGGTLGIDEGSSSGSADIGFDLSNCTLPSDVKAAYLGVSVLQQGSAKFNAAEELIENHETSETVKNLIVYDLKLLDQNHKIITGFSGTVTVRIPIPAGMDGDLHVYWYNDADGTVTDMNAKQENGCLVFDTSHFSYYAAAELTEKATGSLSANDPNPDTGDDPIPFIPAVLLCAAACGLIVAAKSRRCCRKN